MKAVTTSLLALALTACVSNPSMQSQGATTDSPTASAVAENKDISSSSRTRLPSGDTAMQAAELKLGLLNTYGVIENPALNTYLSGLLSKILASAGIPQDCCKVVVLSDLSLDAEARPSGIILLAFGWILRAEDESELVALLAHELAHVLLGHHGSDTIAAAPTGAFQAATIAGALVPKISRSASAITNLNYLASASGEIFHPTWKRSQEREADRFAVDTVAKLGYSMARGPKAMLERLSAIEEAQEKKETGPKNPNEHIKKWISKLGESHDDSTSRADLAVAYYESTWQEKLPKGLPKPASQLNDIRNNKNFSGLIDAFRAIELAKRAIDNGEPKKGAEIALHAKEKTPAPLLPLLTACDAYQASRDEAKLQTCYNDALKIADDSWIPMRRIANLAKQRGQGRNSLKTIESTFARLGRPSVLLPEIVLLVHDIDKQVRDGYVKECMSAGPALLQQCVNNSDPEEQKRRTEKEATRLTNKIMKKIR